MSETTQPKRVALITSEQLPKPEPKKPPIKKSIRFILTLTESNEESCPMFNYRTLLDSGKVQKIEENNRQITNGLDPFGDDVDQAEVERLAKQFEAKYANATPRKKKKKYKGDWADMGAGYDENDSFIDNTDAYDEIVPEDISPEHGGFYINSGSLEFKQEDLCEMEDLPRISGAASGKNRKRIVEELDSDNESEVKSSSQPAEKKSKLEPKKIENGVKKKITPIIPKKATTVKELLKEKRDDGENETTIKEAIESVVSAVRTDESSKDSTSSQSSASSSSVYSESTDDETKEVPKPEVITTEIPTEPNNTESIPKPEVIPLPPNLPDNVIALIDAFKLGGKPEVKGKFSDATNKALLQLNQVTRNLKSSMKSQVYDHLASFVNCTRDTLYRKSRKLAMEHEETKLEESVNNLKELVDRIMPLVIESYSQECQRINEKNRLIHDRDNMVNGEKPKITRLPKRKFHWTDTSRKYLSEIVMRKRHMYRQEKSHKEKFYQYLENYYKSKLVPLWPEGWISSSSLIRESTPYLTKEERPIKVEKRPDIPTKSEEKHKSTKLPSLEKPFLTNKSGLSIEPVPVHTNSNLVPPKSKETHLLTVRNINELLPSVESNHHSEKDSDIEIIDVEDAPTIPKKSKEIRKKKKENNNATDLIQKLMGNAVSITRKTPEDEVSDVVQVMKDIKTLNELSQPISEPVSVIAVNHRVAPSSTAAVAPVKNTVSSNGNQDCGDATGVGFQDVFQKRMFQEDLQPANLSLNNSIDICTYFGSSTLSTSHKMFSKNLTITPSTSITKLPSNGAQQNSTNSGTAALKKDVMLFPNFLYEYHLSKKTGSTNSPPL